MNGSLWNRALDRIRRKVNTHSYTAWFEPTSQESASGRKLIIAVPNPLFAEWLRNNYMPLIAGTIEEIEGQSWDISFRCPGLPEPVAGKNNGHVAPAAVAPPASPPAKAPPPLRWRKSNGAAGPPCAPLNPRYSFDSFVVGSTNRFAHAAATAVANRPSEAYNPLYIYGGVGLGKTHLLQAIGRHLAADGSTLSVHYVPAETFMTELVQAIGEKCMVEFKERYRSYDVLLVDDVSFLAGKERTQEEFFHTFNSLYDARKQIVMTSDSAPREIRQIEDRLRSRLEWGLIADIQPPDLETKIAILHKKAQEDGVDLPSDVALLIASRVRSNVRELEGNLTSVLAHASLLGEPVNLEVARSALQQIATEPGSLLTVESIMKRVAEHYGIKVSQLKSKNNARAVSFPRQVAMYLCKQMLDISLPEIGKRFGGKHHTTVLHAVRKIEEMRRTDGDFDRTINNLMQSLR